MTPMEAPESFDEVLAGVREGSADAFARLWRTLQPSLDRYLRVAAFDAAEDLASETWLQVARDVHRFRGDEDDFRRWFFTIARHRVVDHSRKRRRAREEPVPIEGLAGIRDASDPIEEGISTSAALELIRTLPPAQAEAVALRVVAGLGVGDVARVMGKREGAVRVLTSRGLRALAERLEGAHPREPSRDA